MSAMAALRAALADAERRGLIRSAFEDDGGRIHVVPVLGPPQICRNVRQLQQITDLARRRMVPR